MLFGITPVYAEVGNMAFAQVGQPRRAPEAIAIASMLPVRGSRMSNA